MPCRSAAPDVEHPVAHGREALDDRRPGPARARVRGDADRLVDDDDVVVVVEDDEAVDRLRGGRGGRCRSGQGDLEPGAAAHLGAARGGGAVDADVAGVDQVGGRRAREAEQPRDRDVEAQAVEAVGDGQQPACRSVTCSGLARAGAVDVDAAQREQGGQDGAARRSPESAMLKIGQCSSIGPNTLIQSTTCPRPTPGLAEEPVAQVAERAAEDQPERERPADRPHPARGAHDDDDDRDGDRRSGSR